VSDVARGLGICAEPRSVDYEPARAAASASYRP
jgi:hypothetical protein